MVDQNIASSLSAARMRQLFLLVLRYNSNTVISVYSSYCSVVDEICIIRDTQHDRKKT